MITVYILTTTIITMWLIKMIISGRVRIPKTPFDIPILLILTSRTLSTIFSIDPHTSLWGYYSRFNEGLFSTIAYILLFYAFVDHFNKRTKIMSLIYSLFSSAVLVCLWGIPGHFGKDFSCVLIKHELTSDCWSENSNPLNRMYSTIGQPNWFAAFVSFTIPLGLGFIINTFNEKREELSWATLQKIFFVVLTALIYAGFTFAYSRSATYGLISGLVLSAGIIFWFAKNKPELKRSLSNSKFSLMLILVSFIGINMVFGDAITRRPVTFKNISSNQLESGGTESGQLRLIVWRGAWEVFKHYPLLGSGLETFAYSYYQYRPVEQNYTSEWSFVYNKAHNEYLNYLSTTGILGLFSLIFLIGVTLWQGYLRLTRAANLSDFLVVASVLGGYTSLLVQNMFQFSVVVLSLLFFITPAVLTAFKRFNKEEYFDLTLLSGVLRNSLINVFSFVVVSGLSLFLLIYFVSFWLADVNFANANQLFDHNQTDESIELYSKAIQLRGVEPIYHSQLALAYSEKAIEDQSEAKWREMAEAEGLLAVARSSHNLSYYKNLHSVYMILGKLDDKYFQKDLEYARKAHNLAPTDPATEYNLAVSTSSNSDSLDEVSKAFDQVFKLKPDWVQPRTTLATYYKKLGKDNLAIKQYEEILKIYPEATDIKEKLRELQDKSGGKSG